MVPHVAARKTHQRLSKFSFVTPKRLLQQYLPLADIQKSDASICWPRTVKLAESTACF
jgi:hypothetical protein